MNNQTSWIAASLFIGFIVYVTIKGQLPAFKAAIFNGQGPAATVQNSPTTKAAQQTEEKGYSNQDPSVGPVK